MIDTDGLLVEVVVREASQLAAMLSGAVARPGSAEARAGAIADALAGPNFLKAVLAVQAKAPDAATKSAIAAAIGTAASPSLRA